MLIFLLKRVSPKPNTPGCLIKLIDLLTPSHHVYPKLVEGALDAISNILHGHSDLVELFVNSTGTLLIDFSFNGRTSPFSHYSSCQGQETFDSTLFR